LFSKDFSEPKPGNPTSASEQADLTGAFELFVNASRTLEQQYASLTAQVEVLSADLVRAHARLEALLNALPAAVLLIEDGRVSHFNAAATRLVPSLKTGETWSLPKNWYPGSGPDEFHLDLGGETRTLQLQRNEDGSRSVIQIQDITANLKTVEEKERIDRLASMGQMSAGIAHQIRTPLSTALLYCSHLCSEQLEETERKQFSEKLQRQLIHLERLATEMLQFVRTKPLATQLENLNDLVTAACAQLDGLFNRSNIRLDLRLAETKTEVLVERNTFVSAIVAILENAVQATDSGREIFVSTQANSRRCTIVIEDTGSGIPQEMLARLFEPFSTNRASGTGLGLAIARNTIQSHRGEISAQNVPNGGARFTITLPTLDTF
jgi:two-component system sensor histidine kinase FlrB